MASTIKDIAKLAGVSTATVSRVLNNDGAHRVSVETANKVMDAAITLNYKPNENARNLKKQASINYRPIEIGILLTSTVDSYSDSFFHDILLGIQEEVTNCGYTIIFSLSLGNISNVNLEQTLQRSQVDGIILLGRMSANVLYLVKKFVKNIIYAGINPVNQGFDEVYCDGFECAKLAVKYLFSCGYKKIGYIGTVAQSGQSALINEYRYDGYLSAMSELGLSVDKSLVIDTPLNSEIVFNKVNDFLKESNCPEAFFCANDFCALGALKALNKYKIKVPQKVGIIGIDDIEMSAYSKPMLTTIQIPRREIGIYSVKILADKYYSKRKLPLRVQFPYSLIVRESCLPSKNKIID